MGVEEGTIEVNEKVMTSLEFFSINRILVSQ